ncbi:hypothetical protein J6500_07195 [Bradyrhizobium sp. WSM 1704]|uniref:hypothetical protein n=1 Tax=Bradyrhizobium semiaridum TaxID=2821404 RepID=UPI001CE240CF|nr:hypothetical protein [Bradyrhizobium semiaridum]MCA6121687.1 hypothetical protein [Bradyrhizobium semiaridum]
MLLVTALTLPIGLIPAASAMPLGHPTLHDQARNADVIEVKGGHGHGGHGHGHGWGRGHGAHPYGWSRGRKVGWGHRGCPPGHWKKGWC